MPAGQLPGVHGMAQLIVSAQAPLGQVLRTVWQMPAASHCRAVSRPPAQLDGPHIEPSSRNDQSVASRAGCVHMSVFWLQR
jgi:hypothetical protein